MDFLLQNLAIFLGLIIFACFSWRKIELGIWTIIFFLPLYLLRLNVFGIPSTALELGIYILFIIWLAKNYRFVKLNKIIPDRLLRIGIFLLLAGALISTVFSHELKTGAGILKGWFFDPFLFFIILVSVFKNHIQAINALKIFFISGIAVAAASLFYWSGFLPGGVSYDGRLHGIYASPNYLAMYLSPALIIGVWLFFLSLRGGQQGGEAISLAMSKNRDCFACLLTGFATANKHFLFASIFIILIAIYFTYSYAAWFALVISLLFAIWFLLKGISLKKKIFLFSVFCFLFSVLFVSQSGTGKFESLKNLSYRSSANSRLMIWRSALEIGKDNFIMGIGPGNFQKYYLDYRSRALGTEPYLEWAAPQPHNVFLAFWLETGILGLAGFVIIIIWFFKSGIFIIKKCRSGGIREIAIILLSAMAYVLLHGLFDTTYWKNDLAMIFWLILGLMVAIKKITSK